MASSPSDSSSEEEEEEVIVTINRGDKPTFPLQRRTLDRFGLVPQRDGEEEEANQNPPLVPLFVEQPWEIRRIYRKRKKVEGYWYPETEHPQKLLFEKSEDEEDDEITILKLVGNYIGNSGIYPSPDSIKLHEFVMKSVGESVSARILRDKIVKLRKRYKRTVRKKGENPVFSRPYDKEVFELSKFIWGREGDFADEQRKAMNEEQGNKKGSEI